ncbi:MAG: hypothetical protein AB7T63_17225 [Planctomycetota bacterium]
MEFRVVDVLEKNTALTDPGDGLQSRYILTAHEHGGVWHASVVAGHGHNPGVPMCASGRTADDAFKPIVDGIHRVSTQPGLRLDVVEFKQ